MESFKISFTWNGRGKTATYSADNEEDALEQWELEWEMNHDDVEFLSIVQIGPG